MKPILTIVLILVIENFSFAQDFCAFDVIHKKRMKTDPDYRREVLTNETFIQNLKKDNNRILYPRPQNTTETLYTIPLVVHVIHTGDTIGSLYNPSDGQIVSTIAYLNEVYNGTYPGTQGVGDIKIQFVLAKRDPNCNPTNGINRADGSVITDYETGGLNPGGSPGGAEETVVKDLSRWDNTKYYNIWVVNTITGGAAGFANYPTSWTYEGTVLLASAMKPGNPTLPHEIGHAFSLLHPFENIDENVCPPNEDCTVNGDGICDTDPVTRPNSGTCRTGTNPCTGAAYHINTESNYMNYTNCKTLFTPDQGTKMLAAAAGPYRLYLASSLGGIATNEGDSPCAPKINFSLKEAAVTEKTTQTTGCRAFTDHVYFLTIGNNPSDTATATLTVISGTATQGIDYDISANGNFTSPDMVLTFATGTNEPRPFTVRIYDDPDVENKETFTLGFTVNSNGGNAAKGEAGINLIVTIQDNDVLPHADASITYDRFGDINGALMSLLDGNGTTKRKSQIIYKAREMVLANMKPGKITGLSIYLLKTSDPSSVYTQFTVKMTQTSQRHLRDLAAGESPLNDLSHNIVYSGDLTPVNGWNNITFTTPYEWDGVSNIVVTLCYSNTNSATTENTSSYSDSSYEQNVADYVFSNAIDCSSAFSGYSYFFNGRKPSIKFTAFEPQTPVLTSISAKAEFFAGNSDVYIYDNTGSRLMCHIRNKNSFSYGCTFFEIDRDGTGASPFLDTIPRNFLMNKTFLITPVNSNASGQYEVTFYFTAAEKEGWEKATGQRWQNIGIVKTPDRISDITATTTVELAPAIKDTLGTHYTLTATFNSGFSGFGFGIPTLTAYRFTGNGNWSLAGNWSDNTIPPLNLPMGAEIIIDHENGGECLMNVAETILQGAKITVLPGKVLRIPGDLNIE